VEYTDGEIAKLALGAEDMVALKIKGYKSAYEKLYQELTDDNPSKELPEGAIDNSLGGLAGTLSALYLADLGKLVELKVLWRDAPEDKKDYMLRIYKDHAALLAMSIVSLVGDILAVNGGLIKYNPTQRIEVKEEGEG